MINLNSFILRDDQESIDETIRATDTIAEVSEISLIEQDYQNQIKGRIMIVDDMIFNITAVKLILESTFHINTSEVCEQALNGQIAIELVKQDLIRTGSCSFDVIFMDCQMPLVDGYEATKQIKQLVPENPPLILALTGHTEQNYIEKALASGMD